MKAYLKDLQENPDYTSKVIIEAAEKKKLELEESVRKQKEPEKEMEEPKSDPPLDIVPASTAKVWHEAKSDEGHTYYWNVNTSGNI